MGKAAKQIITAESKDAGKCQVSTHGVRCQNNSVKEVVLWKKPIKVCQEHFVFYNG